MFLLIIYWGEPTLRLEDISAKHGGLRFTDRRASFALLIPFG